MKPKREPWRYNGKEKENIYRLEYWDRVWQVFRSAKRKGTEYYLMAWTPDIDNPVQVVYAESWRRLLQKIRNSSINDVLIPFPKDETHENSN
jgi:hypothetical protein